MKVNLSFLGLNASFSLFEPKTIPPGASKSTDLRLHDSDRKTPINGADFRFAASRQNEGVHVQNEPGHAFEDVPDYSEIDRVMTELREISRGLRADALPAEPQAGQDGTSIGEKRAGYG
jgi:hypothetical protein